MLYVQLSSSVELPDVSSLRPFKAVLIIEDAVTQTRQMAISHWLVESGCLYVMAWGKDCSTWDDSVDVANLSQFDFGDVPDEHHVTTTWHPDESLSEVFGFAKHTARHSRVRNNNMLLVHLSPANRERELRDAFANA